jgi:hypothetical protein
VLPGSGNGGNGSTGGWPKEAEPIYDEHDRDGDVPDEDAG